MNILAHLVLRAPGQKSFHSVFVEDLRGFLVVLNGKEDGDPKQVAVPPTLLPEGINAEVKRRTKTLIDGGYVAQEITPAQPIPVKAQKALLKLHQEQTAAGFTAQPALRVKTKRIAFV